MKDHAALKFNSIQNAFRRTAKSELTKVIKPEGREPINRQAAMIIAPAKWYEKPLPPERDPSQNVHALLEEINNLKAKCYDANQSKELALERLRNAKRDNAALLEQLGKLKCENATLRRQLMELTERVIRGHAV